MSHNDETTKLTEWVCPRCHNTEIERKEGYRVTAEADAATAPAADDD
jgi:predicted RNA-binding Zn-ribbon protein involved in translation (DUF1610 family)